MTMELLRNAGREKEPYQREGREGRREEGREGNRLK
jgi:hypothetical protein